MFRKNSIELDSVALVAQTLLSKLQNFAVVGRTYAYVNVFPPIK